MCCCYGFLSLFGRVHRAIFALSGISPMFRVGVVGAFALQNGGPKNIDTLSPSRKSADTEPTDQITAVLTSHRVAQPSTYPKQLLVGLELNVDKGIMRVYRSKGIFLDQSRNFRAAEYNCVGSISIDYSSPAGYCWGVFTPLEEVGECTVARAPINMPFEECFQQGPNVSKRRERKVIGKSNYNYEDEINAIQKRLSAGISVDGDSGSDSDSDSGSINNLLAESHRFPLPDGWNED